MNEHIDSFAGSQEVRGLGLLTQIIARDRREALRVTLRVVGKYILNIGQTMICACEG